MIGTVVPTRQLMTSVKPMVRQFVNMRETLVKDND